MVAFGSFKYPAMPLSSAIDYAKKLQLASKGNPLNPPQVASILGHSSAGSGAFLTKIADLRAYGILEGRGGDVKTSQIADILTHPKNNSELARAVELVARKIPLFNDLLDRLGSGPYDDDAVGLQLVAISGLPRAQVAEHTAHIGKVIREIISRSRSDDKPVSSSVEDLLRGRGLPTLHFNEPVAGEEGQSLTDGKEVPNQTVAPMGVTLELKIGPYTERRAVPYTDVAINGLKAYLKFLLTDESFWEQVKTETTHKSATTVNKKPDTPA